MFGFGGVLKSELENEGTELSTKLDEPFFSCNGDLSNPSVSGIHGILECYKNSVKNVQYLASSQLAPFLKHTIHRVKTK